MAVFSAGAGKIETYEQCCWQVKGQGQFRPLKGSDAFIGEIDTLETVEEYRVEMLLDEKFKAEIVTAFKKAHPYEVPAFDFVRVESV